MSTALPLIYDTCYTMLMCPDVLNIRVTARQTK